MRLSELIIAQLDGLRSRLGRSALTVVETGTIRNAGEQYRYDDGWSTLTFAAEARRYGGAVYSIDLDVSIAAGVLRLHDLDGHVRLLRGYSIDVLADMLSSLDSTVDVIFLDSENDAQLTFHEYLIGRRLIGSPGLILVDDVEPDSAVVVKGHLLVPWLRSLHVPHRIEQRAGERYSTGVLIVET